MKQNRIAVVTGGSAGLGRAIVREFAARGWDVGILARGEDGLEGAAKDVRAAGQRALAIPTDVADRAAVEAAADRVEQELGPIDVWVNDAMVGVFSEFVHTDPDDFERAVHVNFFGFVNGTRAALSRMRPRGRGGIVQVGSALGHRGIPLQSAYCASKHAIKGFTESVLTELLHEKSPITLSEVDMPAMNTVQFDWVKSKLPKHAQPVPPIYQPEICAKVVVDVAEHPRRRTWVGESTVYTIIGNRLATRVADWYLAKTGYSGQQAGDVDLPTLKPNLYEPSNEGDQGAHGAFDHRSMRISPQTWAIRNRGKVYGAGALAGAALIAVLPRLIKPAARAVAS
ncbi:SDR family oxidoreductase [Amnibacterium sp.]|uniref:SDR family oxidoreductase n=1 Tax=Amnibacterium sp. TaxID=1872496 RepID=UPI003F7CAAA8